jgi:hypothetical protein
LFGINNGEAFRLRDSQQSSISTDYGVDDGPILQVQSDGQLEAIECAQPLAHLRAVQSQESLRFPVMGHEQACNGEEFASGVGEKTAAEFVELGMSDEAGSHFTSEDRKGLSHRQARNDMLRSLGLK